MHYYEIAPNKIIRTDSSVFTYQSETKLEIGTIVLIEIGKNQTVGIVFSETKKPIYKTKSIIKIIETKPIPIELIELIRWMSEYYVTPIGTIVQALLPKGIQKNRHNKIYQDNIPLRNRTNFLLNAEQKEVIKKIDSAESGTFLLHGVTGSGKTEIYIDLIKKTIKNNSSAIVLVPEISLTPQLTSELSRHFDNLLITHSKMTESARYYVWNKALHSEKPVVVVGARSAIFAPISNIGAIIIDESHDSSYKQDQPPKYSALRVATVLGRFHNAKVILGSATPNIIDRFLAEKTDGKILELTKTAKENNAKPTVTVIDMKNRSNFKNHRFLSDVLIEQIIQTLSENKQVLIFHNRRGSANLTICKTCGWSINCPRCLIPLTLHIDKHSLMCHICNHKEKAPTSCPKCGSADIIFKGIGTKLIESEIKKIFPNTNIARFDTDNPKDESIELKYQDLYDGKINIIIGTQTIAKGLDLPHLKTVCIIQADSGLSIPDYSTKERVFQLLTQVVGRVGRNHNQTQVIIQTYQPEHSSIRCGISQDYKKFYNEELQERKKSLFPPFTYLLKITCTYKTEASTIKNIKMIANELKQKLNDKIIISGPCPAFHEKQNNGYKWQIVIKSNSRSTLIEALGYISNKKCQYELDPDSLN